MAIAFIGLGQMGLPMAINLLSACPGLMVHSASGRAYAALEGLGARPTDEPQRLGSCEIVFLSLPDEQTIEDVLFSSQGIAQWMSSGSIVVDTSTIGYLPSLAIETYQQALLHGHGEEDKGAMIKVYEALLGVTFRASVPGGNRPATTTL